MKINILSSREGPSAEPVRFGQLDVIVTYVTDRPGATPDTVAIPKEDFSDTALQKAIAEREARATNIAGKTFEI